MTVKELMNFLSKQNPEAKVITTATQHVEYVEECDPFGYCTYSEVFLLEELAIKELTTRGIDPVTLERKENVL